MEDLKAICKPKHTNRTFNKITKLTRSPIFYDGYAHIRDDYDDDYMGEDYHDYEDRD